MLKNIDYEKIIEAICYVRGIKRCDLLKVLKNKEYKYILLLLLKKYKCDDVESIYKDFLIFSKRSIKYGSKKAEERFFINKEFRDMYFEIESKLGI
ncbi:ribose-5-phosphate isomerase [Clostridium sp.]|uniref:ribose-5-phosphate isomerase n=1 Tax=Clostridium sp. TaxID=1506 RepID=UPI001A50DC8A|nr:ribose-5-phosphate isomerase [Clostridium sp.]MBK5235702.1 ribose-5-phosphate isomerase [Clostridium sp.]